MPNDFNSTYIVQTITEDSLGWQVKAKGKGALNEGSHFFRFQERPDVRVGDTIRLAVTVTEPSI